MWRIYLTIAVVLGGNFREVLFDTTYRVRVLNGNSEHEMYWPFSSYPMYSYINENLSLSVRRMYGVVGSGIQEEIPLLRREYLAPLDQARVRMALAYMVIQSDAQQRLRDAARDVAERYRAARRDSRHQGPPLLGVRVYEVTWQLDPMARNSDRPESKRLLAEYVRPEVHEE